MIEDSDQTIEFNVDIHMHAKLRRISKGLRQLDVAHLATNILRESGSHSVNVSIEDVSFFERGWLISNAKQGAIKKALDI